MTSATGADEILTGPMVEDTVIGAGARVIGAGVMGAGETGAGVMGAGVTGAGVIGAGATEGGVAGAVAVGADPQPHNA